MYFLCVTTQKIFCHNHTCCHTCRSINFSAKFKTLQKDTFQKHIHGSLKIFFWSILKSYSNSPHHSRSIYLKKTPIYFILHWKKRIRFFLCTASIKPASVLNISQSRIRQTIREILNANSFKAKVEIVKNESKNLWAHSTFLLHETSGARKK